ncbi:FHA domain-containing protein [Almyronema epifaneia]|uniref:FHA domain-containing protein n=1 Tax=Almyronema epifaneia S1 TaxID=2991925 RepID=A0ABW6ID48_9CYAN
MSKSHFSPDSSDMWLASQENREIQERLELFQIFSKIYSHHRTLLNDILDLEGSGGKSLARLGLFYYVQGVVSEKGAYLITNLLDGKTRALEQASHIWTVGRDPRQVAVILRDKRLSRCHAAVQYVPKQGFFLSDLDSRNGSFVNGERIHQQYKLSDGDRIRLGSITFSFFVCSDFKTVAPPTAQCRQMLENSAGMPTLPPQIESSEVRDSSDDATVEGNAPRILDETVRLPWNQCFR